MWGCTVCQPILVVAGMCWTENPQLQAKRSVESPASPPRRVGWGLSDPLEARWTEENMGMHGLLAHLIVGEMGWAENPHSQQSVGSSVPPSQRARWGLYDPPEAR
jgi:hypothetical protein